MPCINAWHAARFERVTLDTSITKEEHSFFFGHTMALKMFSWFVQHDASTHMAVFSTTNPWHTENTQTRCYRSQQPDTELQSHLRYLMELDEPASHTPRHIIQVWAVLHMSNQPVSVDELRTSPPTSVYLRHSGVFKLHSGKDLVS